MTSPGRTVPGRRFLAVACAISALVAVVPGTPGQRQGAQDRPSFAAQVESLSEPAGYFDTDNLISNERSYLQVVTALRRAGIRGGGYLGVGPDQNFSYIAATRPAIAFIVDVRRDNMLLHLLFKALFALAPSRADYLALLLGRAVPPPGHAVRPAPIDGLVAYFDQAPRAQDGLRTARRRITDVITRTRVPLSPEDLDRIAEFHARFVEAGLSLRFNSHGRPPQHHYPTYRDLLLETDAEGRQANYLASEEAYRVVKSLQDRDLIIPVVGDISGPSALPAIARQLAARGERLSVFYTSNVEFYLFGDDAFRRYIANLRLLPRTPTSVVIRSVFGRYARAGRPGDGSTSQVHPIEDLLGGFADGRYRSYGQLVAR